MWGQPPRLSAARSAAMSVILKHTESQTPVFNPAAQ